MSVVLRIILLCVPPREKQRCNIWDRIFIVIELQHAKYFAEITHLKSKTNSCVVVQTASGGILALDVMAI